MIRYGALIIAMITLIGCGGSEGPVVNVQGTLLHNGKPISPQPKEDDTVEIMLVPVDKASTIAPTAATYTIADGGFRFPGKTGKGVPPAEYRVMVRYLPYTGDLEDRFKGQFAGAASPLKYTVSSDPEQHIVIDLGKKAVTKK